MSRILVWDLPVRIFHGLLAGGFAAAALIAFLAEDEGPLFPYHAIIGLVLALLVVLRIIWGFIGTRYARFGSFLYGPGAVLTYLRGVFAGRGRRFVGHNPGAAYAIFAMFGLVLGLAVTGVMLSRGNESIKDIHELLAWSLVVVVGGHILGVLVHTLRHRENITRAMIDGYTAGDPAHGIRSARPLAAVVLVGLLGLWAIVLVRSYNPGTRTAAVPLLGPLQLGDSAGDEHDGDSARHDHDD